MGKLFNSTESVEIIWFEREEELKSRRDKNEKESLLQLMMIAISEPDAAHEQKSDEEELLEDESGCAK